MSLSPGVCSVTLRRSSPPEVVDLALAAGLECIEWGGDVHVPHGDIAAASRVGQLTRDAGMWVASYGSYLFADGTVSEELPKVLDTAEALGAPALRVWAPFGIEPGCGVAEFERTVECLNVICGGAAGSHLEVYVEFHGGTLTSSAASALELLVEVGEPNLRCGWQPPYWHPEPLETELAGIRSLSDRLGHIHVYNWLTDGTRCPLEDATGDWLRRLGATRRADSGTGFRRAALLEFVPGDDPSRLEREALTLRRWLCPDAQMIPEESK